MSTDAYFEQAIAALRAVMETQREPMARAAGMLADAIAENRSIFSFGASHSFILTEELVYRTGGLMLINPIYPHGMNLAVRPMPMTSQIERVEGLGRVLLEGTAASKGDVLLVASASGRNPIVIDMALAAREKGLTTIGILSLAYGTNVPSRHSSGKRLFEIVDQVVDQCSPLGDAAVEVTGFGQKVGPLSTVLGCAVVNAIVCQVVANLVGRGVTPPVYVSANMPGGDEHNAKLLAENRDRIFYLK